MMIPSPSTSKNRWQPLLDKSQYDRNPALTEKEQSQLRRIVEKGKLSSVFKNTNQLIPLQQEDVLFRLLQPVYDVWQVAVPPESRQEITDGLSLLIWEMDHRKNSYWAWSASDWEQILQLNRKEFSHRYHKAKNARLFLLKVSYLLCDFLSVSLLVQVRKQVFASWVFGEKIVTESIETVGRELRKWGYSEHKVNELFPRALSHLFIINRSPRLDDLSSELIESLHQAGVARKIAYEFYALSQVLAHLGLIQYSIAQVFNARRKRWFEDKLDGVPEKWADWCKQWLKTSALSKPTRKTVYRNLLRVGRWLATAHPAIVTPQQWTRDTAIDFVVAVDQLKVGDWVMESPLHAPHKGKPLMAASKEKLLCCLRTFFKDLHEWEWCQRRFDPYRCLATPRSVRAMIGPDPRVIADDIWAKLLWAGLNLTEADFPATNFTHHSQGSNNKRETYYPQEMIRAMVIVWLFAGLRFNEFRRLRVGCVRWQKEEAKVPWTEDTLPKDKICWLTVPINKTGTAFTKAVDCVVGEAIALWEKVRPTQQAMVDSKTGEVVPILFTFRGRLVGQTYINDTLIPMLCRKAGVPRADARGNITTHRARSTIASQLYNAKEPLSLFELQEWLGHRLLSSTQHYAKLTPTKVAKAYQKAGYFERNIRTIEVLIDQEAIKSGAAAKGEPYLFYDLGHGYCTYDFFDQCPHRMACAKCSFYRPKGSSQAQLLEGKANLQRMLQQIPLSDEERAAVEEGIEAMEKLGQRLTDIPTPSGLTPNQLNNLRVELH